MTNPNELEGAALDVAVARAEGKKAVGEHYPGDGSNPMTRCKLVIEMHNGDTRTESYCPSAKWEHGGPIIERACIAVCMLEGQWCAFMPTSTVDGYNQSYWLLEVTIGDAHGKGATPLIAAMRAFVASKQPAPKAKQWTADERAALAAQGAAPTGLGVSPADREFIQGTQWTPAQRAALQERKPCPTA